METVQGFAPNTRTTRGPGVGRWPGKWWCMNVYDTSNTFQVCPYAPCVEYLPTFGSLMGSMLVNMLYIFVYNCIYIYIYIYMEHLWSIPFFVCCCPQEFFCAQLSADELKFAVLVCCWWGQPSGLTFCDVADWSNQRIPNNGGVCIPNIMSI